MRRVFDLVVSTLALILLSPLFAIIAIAIKLEDGGPVFFGRARVGRHMREFILWKFRIMPPGADPNGSPKTVSSGRQFTRVGEILQRHYLDHLPQLLNVIRDDLSIVGPRPESPRYVREFPAEFGGLLAERPGLLDPVSTRFPNESELFRVVDCERVYVDLILPAKLRSSLDYARSRTFLSDLAFMFRTLAALLQGRPETLHSPKMRGVTRAFSGAIQFIETRPWIERYLWSNTSKIGIDVVIASLALIAAHVLRFDAWPPGIEEQRMWRLLPFIAGGRILTNYLLGIYRRIWKYTSVEDGILLAISASVASLALLSLRLCLAGKHPLLTVPLGIIGIDFVLATLGMLGVRLLRRILYEAGHRLSGSPNGDQKRVLLVGAGEAGIMAAREILRTNGTGITIRGFVDDNPAKVGTIVRGVPVLGRVDDLPVLATLQKINLAIITMASASRKTIRHILELCESVHVPVRIIPRLDEIITDQVTISKIRPVEIEDLLGRDVIDTRKWLETTCAFYTGKRILVTGAGGSIGRELCRQLMVLSPAELILLDKDEGAIFETEFELKGMEGCVVPTSPVIGNLKIEFRMKQIFDRYRPEVVFHAAAHKHVPLMERNSVEAVLNNVIGTRCLLRVCATYGVERCVMVSTDKAVNPTSIMGATKRVSELMFQAQAVRLNRKSHYSCVRFGNVLGSRGSVIPIFREQIRQGKPLTITDPEMLRYFMTIPEAAQLIIQAGALGERGEIFLLDMGEPVKMIDLAKDMIRLSGLALGEDIDIKVIGARPGEKLREELLIAEEGAAATRHEKIFVAPPLSYDYKNLEKWVDQLDWAAHAGDEPAIYRIFTEMGIGFKGGVSGQQVARQEMDAQKRNIDLPQKHTEPADLLLRPVESASE